MKAPNLRKLIVPEPGYLIGEVDLKGADARVYAWDADDKLLMDAFEAGVNIHDFNFETVYKRPPANKGEYKRAKVLVHSATYGASPKRQSASLGIPISEAKDFQNRWWRAHPAIKRWQGKIDMLSTRDRALTNRLGYTIRFHDRPGTYYTEALAFPAQSTVACVTRKAIVKIERQLPWLRLLLQVHDSLLFTYRIEDDSRRQELYDILHSIVIPYPRKLVIPWSLKLSSKSWGDCRSYEWTEPFSEA